MTDDELLDRVNVMVKEQVAKVIATATVNATVTTAGAGGAEVQVHIDGDTDPDGKDVVVSVTNITGADLNVGDQVKVQRVPPYEGNAVSLRGVNGTVFDTGDMLASLQPTKIGWLLMNGTTPVPQDASGSKLRLLLNSLGLSTVTVPTMRDYVAMGGGGSLAVGASTGALVHAISRAELPNYNLPVTDTHHHPIGSANVNPDAVGNGFVAAHQEPGNVGNATSGPNDAVPTVALGGGGIAMSLVQPSLGVNWFIKL